MSTQDQPLLGPNLWFARIWASVVPVIAALALAFVMFGFLPVSDAPPGVFDRLTSALGAAPMIVATAFGFSNDTTGVDSSALTIGLDKVAAETGARLAIILCIALGIGVAVHRRLSAGEPRRLNATRISGARYADGRKARGLAAALLAADLKLSGAGIWLSPDIRLPRIREIQHLLVIGRPRYGKSTSLRYMLDSILARPRDKLVVYDAKGDVTADWPSSKIILLAPHDTRSWGWAIGKDVLGEPGARELAASLVKVSHEESNWTLGGQEILIAVIRKLQAIRGTEWTWREFGELLDLPAQELRRVALEHHGAALPYLTLDPETNEFDRTAAGYVSTAMAPIQRIVRPLAQAWSGLAPEYQVSLRSWIVNETPMQRTIIFQGAAHLPAISAAWITAALEVMARFCVGPALADDRDRRLWFVLDEFPTVPKIEGLPGLLAQGPSKGICVVLACQNLELVEDRYGAIVTRSIIQTTDVQILFRLSPGPTSKYLTDIAIPKTQIRRYARPVVSSNKDAPGMKPDDIDSVCLVTDHDLATLPRGEAFVLLEGSIVRVRWPQPTWIQHREPMIEAAWVTNQGPAKN